MKIDKIVQEQINHLAKTGRAAVGAAICIVIVGDPDDSSGDVGAGLACPHGKKGVSDALGILLTISNALMEKFTHGECSVVIQHKSGEIEKNMGDPEVHVRRFKP